MGLFKIVYAPLPALLLFVHLARWHSRREVVASLAWSAVGFVLSAAVAVAFFVTLGIWDWVAHTWFVKGPAMRSLDPPPLRSADPISGRLVLMTWPILVAAAIAVSSRRKRPPDVWTRPALV